MTPTSKPPNLAAVSTGPKDVVAFTVSPRSRLWVAVCLGTAGALFAGALMIALAEHVYSFRWDLLAGLTGGS